MTPTNPLITEARKLFDDFPQGLSVMTLKSSKKWLVIEDGNNGKDYNFIAECDHEELAAGITFAANNILAFADKIEALEAGDVIRVRDLARLTCERDDARQKIEDQEREIASYRQAANTYREIAGGNEREIERLKAKTSELDLNTDDATICPVTVWNNGAAIRRRDCRKAELEKEIAQLREQLSMTIAQRDGALARADGSSDANAKLRAQVTTLTQENERLSQWGIARDKVAYDAEQQNADLQADRDTYKQGMAKVIIERDALQAQVEELKKPIKWCPGCRGDGWFVDSTEGGLQLKCDCLASIHDDYIASRTQNTILREACEAAVKDSANVVAIGRRTVFVITAEVREQLRKAQEPK